MLNKQPSATPTEAESSRISSISACTNTSSKISSCFLKDYEIWMFLLSLEKVKTVRTGVYLGG